MINIFSLVEISPLVIFPAMVIFLCACGALLAYQSRRAAAIESNLQEHGVYTVGYVTKHRVSSPRNDHYLTYSYECQDKTYSREQLVDAESFQGLSKGAPVAVIYLPDNPSIAMLGKIARGSQEARIVRKFAMQCLFWACFFGCATLIMFLLNR